MQFFGYALAAPYWGIFALPVFGGLVALYTIRSKPQYQKLPSLRIWRQVLAKKRPNSLLSKYRHSIFFLLQALALALLFLALLRPYRSDQASGDVLLVLDRSASMGALDGRFDHAKERLLGVIDDLASGARVRVIAAGATLEVSGAFEADLGKIRNWIRSAKVEPGPSVPASRLFSFLSSLKSPSTHFVHVATDSYRSEDIGPGLPGARTTLHYVGRSKKNVGLTRLDLRPSEKGFQVAALVRNYSDIPATVRADLVEAQAAQTQTASVSPGGREHLFVFPEASPKLDVLGVKIRVDQGPQDILPVDDLALASPREGAVRVLLVGNHLNELKKAFELQSTLAISQVPAEVFRKTPPDLEAYDLVVAHDFFHPDLAKAPLLLFHPPTVTSLSTGQKVESPEANVQDGTHPLNRYLNLRDVEIEAAVALDKSENLEPVVESADAPLILTGTSEGRRQIYVAFTLEFSNFSEKIAFPIFLANAVRWLMANDSKLKGQFRVGSTLTLGRGSKVEIEDPAGKTSSLEASKMAGVQPFQTTGIYKVRIDGKAWRSYPVSLLSPLESDLRPHPETRVEIGKESTAPSEGDASRGFWRFVLQLSLGLMVFEFLLFSRKGGGA